MFSRDRVGDGGCPAEERPGPPAVRPPAAGRLAHGLRGQQTTGSGGRSAGGLLLTVHDRDIFCRAVCSTPSSTSIMSPRFTFAQSAKVSFYKTTKQGQS